VTKPLTISSIASRQAKSQDAALWDEVRQIFAGFEQIVFTKELRAVFENLHDEELLETLEKIRWTGRPGYPIKGNVANYNCQPYARYSYLSPPPSRLLQHCLTTNNMVDQIEL